MAWRAALGWLCFPVTLFGGVGALLALLARGVDPVVAVTAITIGAGAWLLLAQELLPHREDWNRWGDHAAVDTLHMIFSNGLLNAAFKGLTFGALFAAAAWLAQTIGVGLWPHAWPLPLQLALGLLAGELCYYWAHRMAHERALLWRFHAIHHSSDKLYVLSSGRNHPFNAWVSYASQTVPAILLGASPEVIAILSVFTTLHGMLQHANVAMRLGPWSYVFATADLHRWHHSARAEEGHSDYGSNLVIWDQVFGTWRVPERGPEQVGITDREMPTGFWAQLVAPFAWDRLTRPR